MPLRAFVSYNTSVETGLDGTIGMAFSSAQANYKQNFMAQLASKTSGIELNNYQFYFTQTNTNEDDLYQLYNGTLIFSEEPRNYYQSNFY